MNGPPATAVDKTIIPFSNAIACAPAASSKITFTASNDDGLILVAVDLARIIRVGLRRFRHVEFRRRHDLHRIVFQLIRQFVRAADVKLIGGRAVKLLALALDVQRVARGTVSREKFFRRLARDNATAGIW